MGTRIDWDKANRNRRNVVYSSAIDGFIPPSEWASMRRSGNGPFSIASLIEKHRDWYQKHRKKRRS